MREGRARGTGANEVGPLRVPHFRKVGANDLSCVAHARAEGLMPLLFSQLERDVVVVHHHVLREAEGVLFPLVEEDVGDDGRDGGSQELKSRVPRVPLDRGEHVLGAFQDGHRHGGG